MTADQRITAAAEVLAGARRRKGSTLPPSVLVREDAELRRQLGQVLDVIAEAGFGLAQAESGVRADGSAALAPADLIEVLGALDHAAAFLTERACQPCTACAATETGPCGDDADDLDQADAYRALAARLGGAS